MAEKQGESLAEARSVMMSDREIVSGVTADLRQEFPTLWDLACKFDFAERLGGCTDPLAAEADGALRELWMARTNLPREGTETP